MPEPGSRTLLYFAYGSNMYSPRLKERTPSAAAQGVGYVAGRRLTFDKVSDDGSGKCDIEPGEPTDRAYGVLFSILVSEAEELDKAEGLGKGYEKKTVEVITQAGTKEAIAYTATKKEPVLKPYRWYKAFVVAGAVEHGLPPPYIEWLRTAAPQEDPKPQRRAKNEALLLAQGTGQR